MTDPLDTQLNAHLNEQDRNEALWEAYEDWASNRSDADKVAAYERFLFDSSKRLTGAQKSSFTHWGCVITTIECDLQDTFEQWDYDNNWPDHPDKRR